MRRASSARELMPSLRKACLRRNATVSTLTYIRSAEEQRVAAVLREVSLLSATPAPVWTWSLTEGMHRDGAAAEAGTQSPRVALDFIASHQGSAIFHLKDFHEPLRESAEIRRRLRDVHQICLDRQKFVVITSPVRFIPEELRYLLRSDLISWLSASAADEGQKGKNRGHACQNRSFLISRGSGRSGRSACRGAGPGRSGRRGGSSPCRYSASKTTPARFSAHACR